MWRAWILNGHTIKFAPKSQELEDYVSCIRGAKIYSEKRITSHIVLFPGFNLNNLFLDIADVISHFWTNEVIRWRRKQLPSWAV